MPAPPRPRRLLLVAMDNLGDLVFTSALTPALHAAFPDATIDVWCKAYTADVARLLPHVHDVIAADPPWAVHPQHPRPPIGPFLRSIRAVRRRGYDAAIITGAPWRLAAAVWLTRIPMRIAAARHRNRVFLTHVLPAADASVPVVRDEAHLLAPLGVESDARWYELNRAPLAPLRDELAQRLPARFVALHPFAGVVRKRLPLEVWLQVAFALYGRKLPVLWVGTSAELAELRTRTHPPGHYVDDLGARSLHATAAALSLATLFAGHDSGPAHLAGAFGVPVVDVFVNGNPMRYGPQGRAPARVLEATESSVVTAADILREIDALLVSSDA